MLVSCPRGEQNELCNDNEKENELYNDNAKEEGVLGTEDGERTAALEGVLGTEDGERRRAVMDTEVAAQGATLLRIAEHLEAGSFWTLKLKDRLHVVAFLCEQLLETNAFRQEAEFLCEKLLETNAFWQEAEVEEEQLPFILRMRRDMMDAIREEEAATAPQPKPAPPPEKPPEKSDKDAPPGASSADKKPGEKPEGVTPEGKEGAGAGLA
ncbi:hypothetical protein T484DRAFT_1770188, partial [Baffinella frigidus]